MGKKLKILFVSSLVLMLVLSQALVVFAAAPMMSPERPKAFSAARASEFDDFRFGGVDRFETAAIIATTFFAFSDYAILVNGLNYPDALSAAPLANLYEAPILLTEPNKMPQVTLDAMGKLDVEDIIIVGGAGAVSIEIENTLKGKGYKVSRIAGVDRFDTSVQVAEEIVDMVGRDTNEVVIASGMSFADALSISPIAASNCMPILLVDTNEMPASVANFLGAINYMSPTTYVIGGTGVITDNVKNKAPHPVRLGGIDRFDTNLKILEYFEDRMYYDAIFLASGMGFADALAGSVVTSLFMSPMILVDNTVTGPMLNHIGPKLNGKSVGLAYGGTGVVPDKAIKDIRDSITPIGREVSTDAVNLKIGFAAGDNEDSVTQNLTLPTAGANGTTIVWRSYDPEVITPDGKVTRPTGEDAVIDLFAEISKGEVLTTRYFVVKVKALQ